MRRFAWAVLIITLLGTAILAKGYWNATRDPIIHRAGVSVANWPEGQTPIKVLLLSDIHVAGPDMPPKRLERLVKQFNRLKPDLVLIAGDLVSKKRVATHIYTPKQVVAPLAGLKAPLGVIVAPGNHDHWFDPDALTEELRAIGLTVLQNEAVKRGPIIVGGIDDDYSGHDDIPATVAAMDALLPAPRILVTHSPDVVPDLPLPVAAVFAGHTHCGQIAFPLIGSISYVSRYGDRFACGDINDDGQRVFVGAGLGTSILPLRYGAPPDAWLVTLKP
jgi:uncharacterized protein